MKRIKLKYLRSILFFLLALLFAGLAIVEALPHKPTGDFVQHQPFSVSSVQQTDGTYLHTASGYIQNISSKTKYIDWIVIRVRDERGDELIIEAEANQYIPAEAVCLVSGTVTSGAKATGVIGVNNSALSGNEAIILPQSGLQMTKGFVIFAVLALICLIVASLFLIYRLTHRHHRHHHHSKKSES